MRRATLGRLVACIAALFVFAPAWAVTVTVLTYDASKDQLVMTIAYRGTNPDHNFTVQWDPCKRLNDERMQILGLLVDSQANDLARQEFTKQQRIDLRDFTCRPSKVTIKTSMGFFNSVDIPAAKTKGSSPLPQSEPRNAA